MEAVEKLLAPNCAWMLKKNAPNEKAAPKINASSTWTAPTMYQSRNSLPRSICIYLIGLTVVVYTCSDIKYQPGDHRPARSPAVARQRSGKLNEPPNHQ